MQDQATVPAKGFVWWLTDKSVAEGTPSVHLSPGPPADEAEHNARCTN